MLTQKQKLVKHYEARVATLQSRLRGGASLPAVYKTWQKQLAEAKAELRDLKGGV